jgi:dihydrolipoamide dehydrogenase
MYELGILGGGPAGYVAAERAAGKGLKTVIFEKRELGGVCLNEGCIPTKALLYAVKIADNAREASKYGLKIDDIGFDFPAMMKRKDKVVQKLVNGVAAKMKVGKIEVVEGKAEIEGNFKNIIHVQSNGKIYQCRNLLICTGSEAMIPPVKGLSETEYLTNREILQLETIPESLNIIGGGVVGVEFASLFSSLETKVTVVEMMEEILPGIEPEMSRLLRETLSKKGVEFYLESKVIEAKGNELIVEKDGKQLHLSAEKLLVSAGRKPTIEGFGLEKLNVELFRGGIKIDSNCRTNVPNIYAAGDVTGFSLLAHTASREGEVAVNHITGRKDFMRYNAIPAVVYTNPEIASVGLTEELAREKNIKYKVKTLPMAYAGRFIAENEGKNGIVKILVGPEFNELLGVHMIGNPSSELIYGAAMAIEAQLRIDDLQEIVFPHPTVSEIFRETIFAFEN